MVIWSDPAILSLKSIFDYIAQDSRFYAQEVVDNIIKETENLDVFPKMGRKVPEKNADEFREIFVYSYRIIYEISENIAILNIIHAKQDLLKNMNKKED
ncbi:MAG: type II toxin-antitoxin system RelE/ParE family toxin [Spirochaetaceae bacterium]|nr:MAG: type II toxin-antitoxin system RelE/ParE family toxin [Spirochaetaceae bacterium]